MSIKLHLDVRNDEYIILTILVAIPNPSPPPAFPALSQEVIGEVWRHVTMIALLLDDNKTKDDGDGKLRRTAKNNLFISTNNFARAPRYFVHFFAIVAPLRHESS